MEKKLDSLTRLHILWDALDRVRGGGYICKAITRELRRRDIIPPGFLCDEPSTLCALQYFPELLKYRPEEASPYSEREWFGFGCWLHKESIPRRVKVIESLVAEIKEQELNQTNYLNIKIMNKEKAKKMKDEDETVVQAIKAKGRLKEGIESLIYAYEARYGMEVANISVGRVRHHDCPRVFDTLSVELDIRLRD